MIWHHDGNAEIVLRSVIVQAASEHNRPHLLRQNPSAVSAESNKVLAIVNLKMRQLPPVKSLWHKGLEFELCGDSRLRLSAKRSFAILILGPPPREANKVKGKLKKLFQFGNRCTDQQGELRSPDSRWRLSPHIRRHLPGHDSDSDLLAHSQA
jgi:hypothetical protein